MSGAEKISQVKRKLQLLEKRTTGTFELDFKSIYDDFDSIEKTCEPSYKAWLKRFIKVIILVVILKIARRIMTTSSQFREFGTEVIVPNTESIVYLMVFTMMFTVLIAMAVYVLFKPVALRDIFKQPFILWSITFLTIDALLILAFPDITIALIQAYFKL